MDTARTTTRGPVQSPADPRPSRHPRRIRTLLATALTLLVTATGLVALSAPAQAATGTPVVGVASGLCLDVTGNTTALKTRVIVWTCNSQANQAWTLTAADELRVFGGTRCLDVAGGRTTSGGVAQIYSCSGGANQKWKVNGDGSITGVQSGLCLDVTGASTSPRRLRPDLDLPRRRQPEVAHHVQRRHPAADNPRRPARQQPDLQLGRLRLERGD